MIQEGIGAVIDEKLRGGGMRIAGAGHGDGAAFIAQTIVGLVENGRAGVALD